ncbi:hypothetical protein [Pseudomonas luteola]|uniref:hypothetical protein n=1 Tax=Pseudomonas luteola TaxID=47886 RepID=UPI00123993F7|nr:MULTISPECIES: hypothetical protein [Pseudomonas]MBA1249901.1 hypothetical protein [Pseudomonas zeshuii]QEU28801.1 hypothetical protein FOB45_13845 [Pseudomonas luteola]
MSMREEFEAWATEFHKDEGREDLLSRNGDAYSIYWLQNDWTVWQASRAALSVESCHTHPELILTDEDRAYEQGVQNQLSKVKAAGVQVKP